MSKDNKQEKKVYVPIGTEPLFDQTNGASKKFEPADPDNAETVDKKKSIFNTIIDLGRMSGNGGMH